jgi:hypothetical protein
MTVHERDAQQAKISAIPAVTDACGHVAAREAGISAAFACLYAFKTGFNTFLIG